MNHTSLYLQPANPKCVTNAGLMLIKRLRRWRNKRTGDHESARTQQKEQLGGRCHTQAPAEKLTSTNTQTTGHVSSKYKETEISSRPRCNGGNGGQRQNTSTLTPSPARTVKVGRPGQQHVVSEVFTRVTSVSISTSDTGHLPPIS